MKSVLKLLVIVFFLYGCQKDVPPAPVARFEYRENAATRDGAQYTFVNLTTNAQTYNWTFGDGGSSSEQHPTYVFKKNGTYNVTLKATGEGGEDYFNQSIRVSTVPTTGRLIFWSRIGNKGNITVSIAGSEIGKITVYQTSTNAPDCGTSGFVTVTLPEGTYSYTAKSQGLIPYSWSGSIQIINGMCRSLQLTE